MMGQHWRLAPRLWSAGALLAAYSVLPMFAQSSPNQTAKPPVKIAGNFDQVHVLPPGDPAPRTEDGHVDLTGRYYPNHAGRMLEGGYRLPPIFRRPGSASRSQLMSRRSYSGPTGKPAFPVLRHSFAARAFLFHPAAASCLSAA